MLRRDLQYHQFQLQVSLVIMDNSFQKMAGTVITGYVWQSWSARFFRSMINELVSNVQRNQDIQNFIFVIMYMLC